MYFKLAKWDDRSFCFKDGKVAFATEAAARASATARGRYRISTVTEEGRSDHAPFEVAGSTERETIVAKRAGGLCRRPTPRTRS